MRIDFSKLKELEPDFGDMPEYWEARWKFLDGWGDLRRTREGENYIWPDVSRLYNEVLSMAVKLSQEDPYYAYLYAVN